MSDFVTGRERARRIIALPAGDSPRTGTVERNYIMNIKQVAVAIPLALIAASSFAQTSTESMRARAAHRWFQANPDFIAHQKAAAALAHQGFDVYSPN